MHVCFIEDTHLHGGTQIWVTEANRHFLARGVKVTLLAPGGSWVAEQCAGTGARVVSYDWQGVVEQDERQQKIWTDALRASDVALCTVHPPRQGFHCSVFAARCIREAGLDTHFIAKTGTIVPEYEREFYLPDDASRSSVVAIADFTRRYLMDVYGLPRERVALIYQGVDARRFLPSAEGRAEAARRYPLPENAAPVLGCVGSLERRKGQAVLFEALAQLASGPLPDVHLLLVGDGPDEGLLRERALGLEGRVSFFPFTRQPQHVYQRLDVTVLPSLYKEGLPNVLLESLAMGVPVVASNLGGVREVVLEGETGYVVQPGDSGQLARAIQRLWADQAAYRRMSERGRGLVETKFDKKVQFDRFLEYFKGLQ